MDHQSELLTQRALCLSLATTEILQLDKKQMTAKLQTAFCLFKILSSLLFLLIFPFIQIISIEFGFQTSSKHQSNCVQKLQSQCLPSEAELLNESNRIAGSGYRNLFNKVCTQWNLRFTAMPIHGQYTADYHDKPDQVIEIDSGVLF